MVMVSISSVRHDCPYDKTCILKPGEHSFIKRDSFVYYARARIQDPDALLRGVSSGKLIVREMMAQAVFDRVCQGLKRSPHTVPKIFRFYEKTLIR